MSRRCKINLSWRRSGADHHQHFQRQRCYQRRGLQQFHRHLSTTPTGPAEAGAAGRHRYRNGMGYRQLLLHPRGSYSDITHTSQSASARPFQQLYRHRLEQLHLQHQLGRQRRGPPRRWEPTATGPPCAGTGLSTGTVISNWSYGGGCGNDASTTGSLSSTVTGSDTHTSSDSGTIAEGGSSNSTDSYTVNSDWSNGSWVIQNGTDTGTRMGHRALLVRPVGQPSPTSPTARNPPPSHFPQQFHGHRLRQRQLQQQLGRQRQLHADSRSQR